MASCKTSYVSVRREILEVASSIGKGQDCEELLDNHIKEVNEHVSESDKFAEGESLWLAELLFWEKTRGHIPSN
jgi:hypothetical protein